MDGELNMGRVLHEEIFPYCGTIIEFGPSLQTALP